MKAIGTTTFVVNKQETTMAEATMWRKITAIDFHMPKRLMIKKKLSLQFQLTFILLEFWHDWRKLGDDARVEQIGLRTFYKLTLRPRR